MMCSVGLGYLLPLSMMKTGICNSRILIYRLNWWGIAWTPLPPCGSESNLVVVW